jgi:hypothetical protein
LSAEGGVPTVGGLAGHLEGLLLAYPVFLR